MNQSPIFIHSLFRAGSTYLFSTFRRSAAGYWCYQEPLHELAFFCRENPSGLNEDHGDEKALLLRHPKINGSYFKELQEVWPVWKDVINEQIIYDAYFSGEDEEIGVSYWRALAVAAHSRPVFQECRTSGRIGAIKSQIGGYHIYLWRNPWDQWWSYKVTPYFDAANQLIIRARNAPEPVRLMMADLVLPAYRESDLAGAFAFYGLRPLDSERSYLIFYMLWCLGLKEGTTQADLLLSIDRLSDSIDYRAEVRARLRDVGIDGIDFSDCRIPQGRYLKQEQDFFAPLEERVHEWLKEGGWTQEDLEEVQSVRQRYQPALWGVPIEDASPAEMVEQAARTRELARRFETSGAQAEAKARELEIRGAEQEKRARVAEAHAAAAQARVEELTAQLSEKEQALEAKQSELEQLHAHSQWLQNEWDAAKAKIAELNHSSHHWWSVADGFNRELQSVYRSKSWRITWPLRKLMQVLKWLSWLPVRLLTGLFRSPKGAAQWVLARIIGFVLRRERLRRRARRWLNCHPTLKARVRAFARAHGLIYDPIQAPQYPAAIDLQTQDAAIDVEVLGYPATGELGVPSNKAEECSEYIMNAIHRTLAEDVVRAKNKAFISSTLQKS